MASLFSTAPRLHVRRPSPTAAEFTVTTEPASSVVSHAVRLLSTTLQYGLCLAVVVSLYTQRWGCCCWIWRGCGIGKCCEMGKAHGMGKYGEMEKHYGMGKYGETEKTYGMGKYCEMEKYYRLDKYCCWIWTAAAAALLLLLPLTTYGRGPARESLLVLRGLGVQTREEAGATRFIPTERIRDIVLNEAFRGFEVRYYLVVVVEGETDVVVVFPGLLPPRRIVEEVWRGARECLYEGRGEDRMA